MKKSRQPRKQRKNLYNLSLHKKRKILSTHLSKELRTKYNKRNIPVRKGDKVKILKGKYYGKEGKVTRVNLKKAKIAIEKLVRKKPNGSERDIWFEPSNVVITELNLEDKKREEALKRK